MGMLPACILTPSLSHDSQRCFRKRIYMAAMEQYRPYCSIGQPNDTEKRYVSYKIPTSKLESGRSIPCLAITRYKHLSALFPKTSNLS